MIAFEPASPLPSILTKSDLQKLGQFLGHALHFRSPRTIGARFVTEKEIQRLNRAYRGINRPTDVLSFILDHQPFTVDRHIRHLGDIAICPPYARQEAKRRGIGLREELIRLLAHGTLHLAGFDHAKPREEAKMFKLQERMVDAMMESSL